MIMPPKTDTDKAAREAAYLKVNGHLCLWCKSKNITSGASDFTDEGGFQCCVHCRDCQKDWIDEFTLTGVREDDE